MKGWETNAMKYCEGKDAGVCPDCGSRNVKIEIHEHGQRQSISFLCMSCRSGDHFDGFVPKTEQE